jgi:large repetitive protein
MVTAARSGGTAAALTYSGPGNTPASDGSSTYSWDPSGGLIGVGAAGAGQPAGVLAFTDQHTDVVGNFTAAGSALGGSASYDPLGNVTAAAGVAAGKLGFQSGWTDPATGQVNMAARWYNPAAGQFTSRDGTSVSPVPNPVAANPFAYVDDNPLTRTDPSGASWWGDVTSVVSSGWHYVTAGWDAATSALSRGWNATTSWISSTFDSTISAIKAEARAAARELSVLNQEIRDLGRATWSFTSRAVHTVARAAVHVAHTVVRNVSTAYHEVKTVAKATASFLKHHEAAIVSFAAGAAVFAGCMVITEGVAVVGCAAAAGAVSSLVSYGMSCGSAAGGCTAQGALVSVGIGALGGAVGGALAGPLGGKLASSVLGDVLPALAVQGLTGAAAGAAAGGAAGAAAYGLGCRSSTAGCSWDGLAAATGKTAAGGAITGAAFAVAGSAAGDAWAGLKGASCHSFTGSARVLMADGTSKPISRVKAGDRVTDSVPGDDRTQVHTVQKVIVTATDRDFTQLTITPSRPPGTARPATAQRLRAAAAVLAGAAVLATGLAASPASAATAAAAGGTLTTTYTHPFYDITQAAFTPARNLHVGDKLQQPGGRTAVITGIRLFHTTQTTYDLTINGLHTYYVIAGRTPVLVHNCGESAPEDNVDLSSWVKKPVRTYQTYTKENPETGQVYSGKTSGYGMPAENVAQRNYGHAYNRLGYGPARLDQSSMNADAIRGREQMLIDYYVSLGKAGNRDLNPVVSNREYYIQQAINEFGPLP